MTSRLNLKAIIAFWFTFSHLDDVDYVMSNRLWTIHNILLVIHEWPPNLAFEELALNESPFWVHVLCLSPNVMSPPDITSI